MTVIDYEKVIDKMMSIKLPLVVTSGEPAGIGGELTIKAWKNRKKLNIRPFFTIDCPNRLRKISVDLPIKEISSPEEAVAVFDDFLPVLPIKFQKIPENGMLNPKNAKAVIKSIKMAVDFCLKGQAGGVITNPIHKSNLYEAGFSYPGHTEFIADLCSKHFGKEITPVMMLAAKDLKVVPLTIHIPLQDVPQAISGKLIKEKCQIIDKSLKADFKIDTPRIVIAGLNPHAGEGGKIGLEDQEIITPVIEEMQKCGLNVSGPYPADTLFHEEARANYDLAVGMYHDQALIPLKTLDFHGGVNVTIGLPIVRTSPDHGTAIDIAGRGIARADSFINAIKMASEISENRVL